MKTYIKVLGTVHLILISLSASLLAADETVRGDSFFDSHGYRFNVARAHSVYSDDTVYFGVFLAPDSESSEHIRIRASEIKSRIEGIDKDPCHEDCPPATWERHTATIAECCNPHASIAWFAITASEIDNVREVLADIARRFNQMTVAMMDELTPDDEGDVTHDSVKLPAEQTAQLKEIYKQVTEGLTASLTTLMMSERGVFDQEQGQQPKKEWNGGFRAVADMDGPFSQIHVTMLYGAAATSGERGKIAKSEPVPVDELTLTHLCIAPFNWDRNAVGSLDPKYMYAIPLGIRAE